jgi:hypothetical protein
MLALLTTIAAASVPNIGCAQQAYPAPPVPSADQWVIAGPAAWASARPTPVARRRESVFKKAGLSVDAGRTVTLRMLSPRAALIYRHAISRAERWQDADRVLRVKPCSGQPRTGFPGLLIADRRKCVRVRVSRGGESWVARLPVGRRCA